MIQMNLQNGKRLIDLENELMVARGKGQLGSLGRTCTIAIFQMDNQRDLVYSNGTLLNVIWQLGWEGSSGKTQYA